MTTADLSTPRMRRERPLGVGAGAPVVQTAGARVCAHPGCGTRLSRYNPNTACAAHGGWTDASTRRNRDLR